MKYIFDSNVFIQAKNTYYDFDFCPAFWEYMIDFAQNINGGALSVLQVKEELKLGNDDLAEWAKALPSSFFIDSPQASLRMVVNYINTLPADRGVKDKFVNCGDPYIIAAALHLNITVVTQEVSAPVSRNKIKIPDVCKHFNIKCINTFDFLKYEKAKFIKG